MSYTFNRHTAIRTAIPLDMSDYEIWLCAGCLHVFIVPPPYAASLFEYGCAYCGSHEFALYDLLRELEGC